jgi:hypothetical protein
MNIIMDDNAALNYAKYLMANGQKIEAIKVVRYISSLPLEKGYFNGKPVLTNSLKAAKEFVENGFIIPYVPQVGDTVSIFGKGEYKLIALSSDADYAWCYNFVNAIYVTVDKNTLTKLKD